MIKSQTQHNESIQQLLVRITELEQDACQYEVHVALLKARLEQCNQQPSKKLERQNQEQIEKLTQTIEQLNTELIEQRLADEAKHVSLVEERNQLANEIHDTLAQAFAGIAVQVELAQFLIHQNPTEVTSALTRIEELTQLGLTKVRRSVRALHSTTEDYANLADKLSQSIERMTQGIPIDTKLIISGEPYLLPPFIGRNLLRIGQEAISNVLKHAQASFLKVELSYAPEEIVLCVRDNGRGFSMQESTDGFGLISMSERADRINSYLMITSQPGNGTEILVRLPMNTHKLSR